VTREQEKRRAYVIGYLVARRRAQAELAAMRAERDELRAALREWRAAVEARRRAKMAIVSFHRSNLSQAREGVSLH
jgi:uncharacterized coiled-coil DUF342 family protein